MYPALLRYVACDPGSRSPWFQDEPNPDRLAGRLMRADGSVGLAYASVPELAANGGWSAGTKRGAAPLDDGRRCKGHIPQSSARVPRKVNKWSILARADEDAFFTARHL